MRICLFLVILIFLFLSCSKTESKKLLNFPSDAEYVVIFGQSSHLDISWFYTSEEYYDKLVKNIFLKTTELLRQNTDQVAFFAEMFWIEKYLDETKDSDFLNLIREGRIKIEGGGIGTDEQLVVPTEGIIRNYISGHRKIKELLGIQAPSVAWIPDSFGFARTTPDLYSIMGFKAIGISRVNGFSAPTSYYYIKPLIQGTFEFPEGSVYLGSGGYELLQKGQLVLWEGIRNKIILYWMPFLYGIGSSLFCKSGLAPNVYLNPDLECLGESDKATEEEFCQKLLVYISKIKPNSKFIFIPLGWDFEKPNADLGKYIKYWNQNYYPKTKIYLVNGSFSDYIEFIEPEKLTKFSGHLAPYWTGYFGSHAEIKRFIFDTTHKLLAIETSASIGKLVGINFDIKGISQRLNDIWELMGMMTNHDTGAGTLYKRVYKQETIKLMESVSERIKDLENQIYLEFSRRVEKGKYIAINPLSFQRDGIPPFGLKVVDSLPQKQIKECTGEKIRSFLENLILDLDIRDISGSPFFSDSINKSFRRASTKNILVDIVLWEDDGGSWRIGSETPPGKFQEKSEKIYPDQCYLIDGRDKILINLKFNQIPIGHSLTLRFSFSSKITSIKVESHLEITEFEERYRVYNPTFLPYLNFFKVYTEDGESYTFSTKGAKGVAQTSNNSVDIFVGRNVKFEKYDILGPIGDMDEDGPFEIDFQITRDSDDQQSLLSAYSYQFPIIFIKGSGEKTEIPQEFSIMEISQNVGILFSDIEETIVRTVLPSENLDFVSDIFKSAKPISPVSKSDIKFSNTFKMQR